MEFLTTANMPFTANELQRYLRIESLPHWCASIQAVLSHQGERGRIFCTWGEFAIHQEILRDGVRFTLPDCPSALQWTITADGETRQDRILVHCTINRREHDSDFIEVLEQFLSDWKAGLESWQTRLQEMTSETPATECAPWYG